MGDWLSRMRRVVRRALRDELRERVTKLELEPAEGTTLDTQGEGDHDECEVCGEGDPVELRSLSTRYGFVIVAACVKCAKLSTHLAQSHFEDRVGRTNNISPRPF